jgi:hypothetical protein
MKQKHTTIQGVLQEFVNKCSPGASRDQLQRGIDTMNQRARDLPRRMAAQAPFADESERLAIEISELDRVLAGWEAGTK